MASTLGIKWHTLEYKSDSLYDNVVDVAVDFSQVLTLKLRVSRSRERFGFKLFEDQVDLTKLISILSLIIADDASHGGGMGRIPIVPDFSIQDSEGQTVLELALWTGQYQVARSLLDSEADINHSNRQGHSLLHKAIMRKDIDSSLFLIENEADFNKV